MGYNRYRLPVQYLLTPSAPGLGIEDHLPSALRAPSTERPPGLPGCSVKSALHLECLNRIAQNRRVLMGSQ
jgi:hypothetical protein